MPAWLKEETNVEPLTNKGDLCYPGYIHAINLLLKQKPS